MFKYQQDPKNHYIITDMRGNQAEVFADTAEHARRIKKRGLSADKYMWKIKVKKVKEDKMDYKRAITAVMVRAASKKVVLLTNDDDVTGKLAVALAEWCKDRKLKSRDWFDSTIYAIYVSGYHEITIMHAAEFNQQRRREYPGEVYTIGSGIITTLETEPLPIEHLINQVGA